MSNPAIARPLTQRAVCLLLSLVIVSAGLTLGAFGIESMVSSAEYTVSLMEAAA